MELENIIHWGDQVFFTAIKDGGTYRFAVSREALDDLAHYKRDEASEELDRLAVFEDFQDRIAREAETIISAGFTDDRVFILTSDHLCN